jgi:hypothetical protein
MPSPTYVRASVIASARAIPIPLVRPHNPDPRDMVGSLCRFRTRRLAVSSACAGSTEATKDPCRHTNPVFLGGWAHKKTPSMRRFA